MMSLQTSKKVLSIVVFFCFSKPVQLILFPDPDFESSLKLLRGQHGKYKRTTDILLN